MRKGDPVGASEYDKAYHVCAVEAPRLLKSPNIQERCRVLLNEMRKDEVVDSQRAKVIMQGQYARQPRLRAVVPETLRHHRHERFAHAGAGRLQVFHGNIIGNPTTEDAFSAEPTRHRTESDNCNYFDAVAASQKQCVGLTLTFSRLKRRARRRTS